MRVRDLGVAHQAFRPLEEAGFPNVEDLAPLSIEELAILVQGSKALHTLMEKLGREDEYLRYIGKYDVVIETPEGPVAVPAGRIRQLIALNGTAAAFGFNEAKELQVALKTGYRLASDGRKVLFSDEDIARYWIANRAKKAQEAEETQEEEEVALTIASVDREEIETAISEMMAMYARDYDKRQFLETDLEDIRRLARLEYIVRSGQESILYLTTEQRLKFATQINTLQDQITRAMGEIRRQKDALKLSLGTRNLEAKQKEAHLVVTDLVRDAKSLIAEHGSVAIHCGVRQALLILPFPKAPQQPTLLMKCTVCGAFFEWTLVTPDMADLYVEADDFEPADAPEGAFTPRERAVQVPTPSGDKRRGKAKRVEAPAAAAPARRA